MVSLSSLYWLVSILCVLQAASSVLTIRIFGWPDTGPQFFLLAHAVPTFAVMQYLIPSTRRIDHRLSLVNNHVEPLKRIIFPVLYAILRIRRRSRAIHPDEIVLPVLPIQPPPVVVPAWGFGTVAETEQGAYTLLSQTP
ncbi:hypothetical protein B0H13DRAFT_2113176 [Mycena leptocephala]|nr:hypothetical protein B0H13DRAFT_2113176 [Mycena leptocephala]